ncbi:MAG: glycosyltransferase family 39 protein [Chloroflexi bacterium]|nr:glycosyltransferase family 39 protein [Chloroflexota bacterium]
MVFLLGFYLTFARPLGRGPDEFLHLAYIHHLINNWQLPVATLPAEANVASQESVQPPLYYLLSALTLAPLPGSFFEAWSRPLINILNFTAKQGWALENSPLFAAPPDLWPMATLVSGYLLRILSIVLGIIGFIALYLLGKHLTGNYWLGLASALWLALTPAYLETTSSVTNDALLIPLAGFTIYSLFTPGDRKTLILGLLLGLLALTKVNGLLLLLPGIIAMASPQEYRLRRVATILLLVALIAGWWYLRNLFLYGEPSGISAMLAIEAEKGALSPEPLSRSLTEAVVISLQSLVAPLRPYLFLGVIGLIGLIPALRHAEKKRVILLLAFILILGGGAFILWAGGFPHGRNARLLLPVLPALSALWAMGMASLVPKHFYALVPGIVVLGGLPGLVDGFRAPPLYENAYQFIPVLSPYDRPSIAQQTSVSFGENLVLRGYTLDENGKNLYVSLLWSLQKNPAEEISIFVHIDRAGGERTLAQSDTFPPYDTPYIRSWPRGVEVVNVHRLRLPQRRPLWVQVGAYHRETLERLVAVDQNGERLLHDLVLIDILE